MFSEELLVPTLDYLRLHAYSAAALCASFLKIQSSFGIK